MPSFRVETPQRTYDAIVERGAVRRIQHFLPPKHGKIFVVTTRDVWTLHSHFFAQLPHNVIFFPGGESKKRLAEVEAREPRRHARLRFAKSFDRARNLVSASTSCARPDLVSW